MSNNIPLIHNWFINDNHLPKETQSPCHHLQYVFKKNNLQHWLMALVNFYNQYTIPPGELPPLIRTWNSSQQQDALNYFSNSQLINLVNGIFFYKLYPDRLFAELIHPEKLVSIRMRLEFLHRYIESMYKELYKEAIQEGLKPEVDYFFHGEDLPQGIMIEEQEFFQEWIQSAIKQLNVTFTLENEAQETIERMKDLMRAYKYWFNPNRLIDAVMVLKQRLVKESINEKDIFIIFHQEMLILYQQLDTTECLDLYGYFSNKDTRYLLATLFAILNSQTLDWLPPINEIEKKAIEEVFLSLQCITEALRVELNNRHVFTEAYSFNLKKLVQPGARNRDAVFRILAIYGRTPIAVSEKIEKLFQLIEAL